jgi:uncharacterized membrane protein
VNAPSTAAIAGHPLHATLVPFPIVCFTLALATDVLYWRTADMMWQNFSAWLLLAGLVVGCFAALFGLIDLLFRRSVRRSSLGWVHGIGNLVVLVLAFFNNLVHSADAWTAVVPWGLVLSAATVLAMIVTVWLGRTMVFREAIGVSRHV